MCSSRKPRLIGQKARIIPNDTNDALRVITMSLSNDTELAQNDNMTHNCQITYRFLSDMLIFN